MMLNVRMFPVRNKIFSSFLLLLFFLFVVFSSYPALSYIQPDFLSVEENLKKTLVEPELLNSWIKNDCKNGHGYPVVIVDTSPRNYENGHIPNAVNIPWTEFSDVRNDGPVIISPMVATGEKMDSILQKMGITDTKTIIVFTSNSKNTDYLVTRPWWTLFYWGFSPKYIKVLDGGNNNYLNHGYELTTTGYAPAKSQFSVRNLNNSAQMDKARKSVGDMINLLDSGKIDDGSIQILSSVYPSISLVDVDDRIPFTSYENLNVYYNGVIQGAKQITFPVDELYEGDGSFKSKEEIISLFSNIGIVGDKPIITYCNRGNLASLFFFALKVVAGYDNVAVYDGSWSEWGKLTSFQPTLRSDFIVNKSGSNNFLIWDREKSVFIDSLGRIVETGGADLVIGGTLNGSNIWDTVHLSRYITFNHEAVDSINFPVLEPYKVITSYNGSGDEVEVEDKGYLYGGIGAAAVQLSAPAAEEPEGLMALPSTGGGC